MKKISIFIMMLAVAVVSCNKADVNEEGVGVLNMSVNPLTKAALSADELLSTASVKIYKANYKGLVRSYTYSTMPSPFYLAADTYRVDVEAGEAAKQTPSAASWEQKSYKGSKEFVINANQVTNVEVEATVNNAVTCIGFDPTVAENFEAGYTFTIGLDSDDASTQLVYDASKADAEGYFIIDGIKKPSFTWTFTGTLLKDGSVLTKTGTINDLQAGRVYKMNLKYTIKDGDLAFSLMVDYTTDIIDDTIVFEPVSTGLAPSPIYEIWATRATIHADVDPTENAGATIQFAYSSNGVDWTYVDGINDNDGTYHAELTGLSGSTTYSYKLLVNGVEAGEPTTLTTAVAEPLPNAGFEYVSEVQGQTWYKFYDPNCGVDGATTKFWASGNGDEETDPGALGLPGKYAVITRVDKDNKRPGTTGVQSVLAESKEVMDMKLAAGNLFTGQFVKTEGTSGGIVNFGQEWKGYRPSALKIWCKYTTSTMDYSGDAGNVSFSSNDYDRAQIKIAIGTWDSRTYKGPKSSPVQVNTTKPETFVDFFTDPATIANGEIIIYHDGVQINRGEIKNEATGEWKEYTIPLDYRNLVTFPTHIIISCAASQYGDYFVGSTSSKLWLDDFELIY